MARKKRDDLKVLPVPVPLFDEAAWAGWRVHGSYLIAPDGQRIHQRRLRGLMWREQTELHRAGFATRAQADSGKRPKRYGPTVKVVVIDLAELRVRGRAAG